MHTLSHLVLQSPYEVGRADISVVILKIKKLGHREEND